MSMEGFLICTGQRTNQPLFIYETKTNIFSVEELCFYIYENIETLDNRLFDDRLTEFFKRCDREDIAMRLEAALKAGAGLSEFVRAVLLYVNYYSRAEVEELCIKVKSFEGQPVEERLKAVGDTLLKTKKYAMAKKQYRRLLEMDVNQYMDKEFYGKIWHNLGVVYARMLYFRAAVECFKTAYDIFPDESVKMSLIKAIKLVGDVEEYGRLADEEAKLEEWEAQWELEEKSVDSYLEEEGEVQVCTGLYHRGQMSGYNESVKTLIEKWKTEYREQTR